jgi:hypothetical protein
VSCRQLLSSLFPLFHCRPCGGALRATPRFRWARRLSLRPVGLLCPGVCRSCSAIGHSPLSLVHRRDNQCSSRGEAGMELHRNGRGTHRQSAEAGGARDGSTHGATCPLQIHFLFL